MLPVESDEWLDLSMIPLNLCLSGLCVSLFLIDTKKTISDARLDWAATQALGEVWRCRRCLQA